MSRPPIRELTPEEYLEIRESPEFGHVRRSFRRFAFPTTAVFLAWYMAFVLLSVYARDFMSLPLWGESFNVGHFLGLVIEALRPQETAAVAPMEAAS